MPIVAAACVSPTLALMLQIYDLEKAGGSIIGGTLKLLQVREGQILKVNLELAWGLDSACEPQVTLHAPRTAACPGPVCIIAC